MQTTLCVYPPSRTRNPQPSIYPDRTSTLPPLLLLGWRLVGLGVRSLALPPGVVEAIAQVVIVRILDGRGQRRRSARDGTQRHLRSGERAWGQTLSRAEGGGLKVSGGGLAHGGGVDRDALRVLHPREHLGTISQTPPKAAAKSTFCTIANGVLRTEMPAW